MNGPRAKLNRANEHLNSLDMEISSFAKAHPEVRTKLNQDGVWLVLSAGPFPKPDAMRWAIVMGDAIHNMRIALDYAACECIVRSTGKEPTRVNAFPVLKFESSFLSEVRARKKDPERSPLYGLPLDGPEWTVIENAQPYNRSPANPDHERLAVLAHLSNRDKHRSLYVHMMFADPTNVLSWPTTARVVEQVVLSDPVSFERSTEVMRMRFSSETQVHMKGNLVVYPSFGDETHDGAIQASVGAARFLGERVGEILNDLGF